MAETINPGAQPETVEVDIGNGKVALPKADAERVIAWRDSHKGSLREAQEKLGKIEAERAAAEAARVKAEEDKAALEAAKKGEVDEVRRLLTADATKKIEGLATKYRDQSLRAAVSSLPSLLKLPDAAAQAALVSDVVSQLRGSCRFDLDTDTLQVIGADGRPALGPDGKPMAVDAFIAAHVEARPYLRQPTQTPGSGGAGAGKATSVPSINSAAFEALSPIAKGKFLAEGGKIEG